MKRFLLALLLLQFCAHAEDRIAYGSFIVTNVNPPGTSARLISTNLWVRSVTLLGQAGPASANATNFYVGPATNNLPLVVRPSSASIVPVTIQPADGFLFNLNDWFYDSASGTGSVTVIYY